MSSLWFPLKAFGAMMAIQTLLRLIFWAYNLKGGGDYTSSELLTSLVVGIRFDIATLCMTGGIFLLFLSLPTGMLRRFATYRVLNIILTVVLFIVSFVNAIDVIYYGFASKRITHELFTTKDDLGNFGLDDFFPYWWLLLIWWGTTYFFFMWMQKHGRIAQSHWRGQGEVSRWHWITPVLVGGALFVGMRGGLQLRPLRPANAFVTSSFFLGNVSLNTGYTILSSIDIGKEAPVAFMEEGKAVELARKRFRNDFDGEFVSQEYPLVRKATFDGPERKLNVVLLIVESFNALKIGALNGSTPEASLTPNFDTLARHGRLFSNFYSNGSRSVESLPGLLNAMPDIFSRPMIGSSYETNRNWGIGNILHSRGYHTSFFCGGENGTMGFDAYSRVSGIQNYYGRNEFPGSQAEVAGNWGVHDQPFSKWMAEMQNTYTQPFFSVWFSISNHFPFSQPADCPKDILAKGLSPNDMTIMYTDRALGEYFKQVRQQAWSDSTIFLITGDHCFYAAEDPPRAYMTNFQVPLLIIGPGVETGVDGRLGGHLNLVPTLIELLRLDTYHASASVSLLSKANSPAVLNNLMGVVNLARDSVSYSTNFEQVQPCYKGFGGKWERWVALEKGEGGEYDEELRAIYQVCNNTRISNKLIGSEWMK